MKDVNTDEQARTGLVVAQIVTQIVTQILARLGAAKGALFPKYLPLLSHLEQLSYSARDQDNSATAPGL